MLLRKFTLFILLAFFSVPAFSQRSANWFFGDKAGIKFTSPGVTNQVTSVINTDEGCSSISDSLGNLLFYTDGITVWNRNHQVMTNGSGLLGNSSSSQSSIVVPKPGSTSLYYLFTATLPGSTAFYSYSVIDMTLQGGLGAVTDKNVKLGFTPCSERITAMQHANKTDFWIITNPINTDSFNVYLLNSSGVQPTPVGCRIGKSTNDNFGMLKGSPDGKMVVHTVGNFFGFDVTQLFRFDASTGILSNLINIPYPKTYGCAFSPDSKRLYLNNSFPATSGNPISGSMAQFTVSNYDSAAIAQSKYIFPITTTGGFGDLSVGPDSVMYLARHSSKRLSAIKRPNDSAAACQYVDTAIVLTGISHYGLPNFYNNINTPPQININFAALGCLQYRFSFNTNYNGTGTYTWDLGDGTLSSDSSPVHTYVRNGIDSFLVKFNFISTDGTVNISVQNWLKLPPRPIAAFTAQTTGCIEKPITLTNTSNAPNGGIVYSWNFGDNTFSQLQLPVKTYTDTGHYTIRFSVKDGLGCLSDTISIPVVVNKKAIARFDINGPYCTNTSLKISDTSVAWNTTLAQWWYETPGGNVTNAAPINFTSFNATGAFPVRLAVTTPEGCSDTASKTFDLSARPVAGFIRPKNCITDLSVFTDTSSVAAPAVITKWRWYFDDPAATNDTSLTRNPSYQYSAAANYNVQLIVTTNKGCTDTITQLFTVNGAQPKAGISFTADPVCGIDSVGLVNNSSVNFGNIVDLQIDWGNGITTDAAPVPGKIYRNRYPLFGTPAIQVKPLRLTVQSGISCTSVLDTFITIKAQPRVQMQAVTALCGNASPIVLIEGSEISGAAGAESYSGSGVSYDAANNAYLFTPAAITGLTTAITYRYTTPGGCSDTASQIVTLLPIPKVNAGADQVILFGDQVTLNGTASGTGLTYRWSPSLWLNDPSLIRPTASPKRDTSYTLKVTSSDNCSDSSKVFIRVLQPVNPPNVITPNNDGVNDTWNIPVLKSYSRPFVQVFNRWGQLLYQNVGYQKPWDGTFNGSPLPVGTYYYIILPGEGSKPVTGWLLLLK